MLSVMHINIINQLCTYPTVFVCCGEAAAPLMAQLGLSPVVISAPHNVAAICDQCNIAAAFYTYLAWEMSQLSVINATLQQRFILTWHGFVCVGEAAAPVIAVVELLSSANDVNSFARPCQCSCDGSGDCCPLLMI
jgi:hypothetical protein